MSTLVGVGEPGAGRSNQHPPVRESEPPVHRRMPVKDPRAPLAPASDPLEIEIERVIDELIGATRGRPGPCTDPPPPALAPLERLVDERVQLCADLCQLLWATHGVESAIRRELQRCTSSQETRVELLRQCFARARVRLSRERDSLLHPDSGIPD